MWIFLGIVLFIILLVTVILLLPIDLLISVGTDSKLAVRVRFLFKTYGGGGSSSNGTFPKAIKKLLGINSLETKEIKKDVKKRGVQSTVSQTFDILLDLIHEIKRTVRHCVATKFHLNVVCADENAGDAAINYGVACAVIYPAISFLESLIKMRNSGKHINISCDFEGDKTKIYCDAIVRIRICHIAATLLRVAFKAAKREIIKQAQ